jgi:hypothetical protein
MNSGEHRRGAGYSLTNGSPLPPRSALVAERSPDSTLLSHGRDDHALDLAPGQAEIV